jgi:hypothetical protein
MEKRVPTGLTLAKNRGSLEISLGDIVLVKNEGTARCNWKLGKVQDLIPGKDGKVRTALVKIINDGKRPIYIRRVVQHHPC